MIPAVSGVVRLGCRAAGRRVLRSWLPAREGMHLMDAVQVRRLGRVL
jgi:hypothetical protein